MPRFSLGLWRLVIGTAAVTLASVAGANAAPSLVGMLSCTAEPAPSEAKALGGWKLSCTFAQAGTSAVQHYAGEITGLNQDTTMAAGKALLVWNVLAAPAPRKTASLVGIYKTTQDAALPPQSLIGGRDETIILQWASDLDANMASSVQLLQLELPNA
jgi:hypothetical protein